MKMMPLYLGNIIPLKEKGGVRESIYKQFDKKFGVPEEQGGVWGLYGGDRNLEFSRNRKGQTFFFFFFFFKPRADNCTANMFFLKLCTNDYIKTMYLLEDMFLLLESLLTNPVILIHYESGSGKIFLLLVLIPLS